MDVGGIVHIGLLCVGFVKLTIRVLSGSISIPGDELDKFNLIILTKMFMKHITLELSRQYIYQTWHN
jgi:hypothetical protein